jgi:hypothetical protein
VSVERVMTDNGSACRSRQRRNACHRLALRHLRTKPSTSPIKAERSSKPACAEWAYACPEATSPERAAALMPWLKPPPRPAARCARPPAADQSLVRVNFLGATAGVPACRPPRPVRRRGARSTAGDRRQPARSILAPVCWIGPPRGARCAIT